MRLSWTWTLRQPRGLQGQSIRGGPVGQTKPRFQTSPVQTARDALRGRGVHHYRGNPPQLRYTPIADAASRCRGNPSLLRYTPTADAACRCRGNPLQQRDSAAGRGGEHRTAQPGRASQQQGGASAGKQWLVCVLAGQDLNGHPKIKPKPLNKEHLRKKRGFFNELGCSRIKHSSLTALNEQQSSQLSN